MSELKYYKLFHRASALTSPEFISVVEFGNGDEIYCKSEADKVIAELEDRARHYPMMVALLESDKKEIAELKDKLQAAQLVLRLNKPEALYSNLETMSRLSHKIDVVERREIHQKYKRCLAMARWCETELEKLDYKNAKDYTYKDVWRIATSYFTIWHRRWLELAEKFKEV